MNADLESHVAGLVPNRQCTQRARKQCEKSRPYEVAVHESLQVNALVERHVDDASMAFAMKSHRPNCIDQINTQIFNP